MSRDKKIQYIKFKQEAFKHYPMVNEIEQSFFNLTDAELKQMSDDEIDQLYNLTLNKNLIYNATIG